METLEWAKKSFGVPVLDHWWQTGRKGSEKPTFESESRNLDTAWVLFKSALRHPSCPSTSAARLVRDFRGNSAAGQRTVKGPDLSGFMAAEIKPATFIPHRMCVSLMRRSPLRSDWKDSVPLTKTLETFRLFYDREP